MSERWNSIEKPQISSFYSIGSHFKYKIIILHVRDEITEFEF